MTFEFDGAKYAKVSAHQKEWGAKLISEFKFAGNECILDLGCGDGAITAQLAKLVPEGFVIGIDASRGMIDTARKMHNTDNLRFKLMDINRISFRDEFDLVFSNATLHWVKDHRKMLMNVFYSLRDNGAIRFNFAANGNCSHFLKVIKEVMTKEEYIEYFKGFEWPWYMPCVEEYEKILSGFAFKEVKVWCENADRYFANIEAMVGWVEQPSIVPFLKCVDKKDKESFQSTVVERMIQETIQNDGKCFETFRRINVFAKK